MAAGKDETVKGMSWKLLYGNYRGTIGPETWDELVHDVDGPDVVKLDPMDDVPMEPLNRMVQAIDRIVGKGTGTAIDDIAAKSVHAWANYNKNLVKQLHGEPHKMMEVFATEVHPFFLNDPAASTLGEAVPAGKAGSGVDGGVQIDLPNGLDAGFKVGLLKGFVALTGARADVEQHSGGRYTVTWALPSETRSGRMALLANAVRAPFLTASLVPVLVGWALAWNAGIFDPSLQDWSLLALIIAATSFFHFGTNVMNDYYDHRSGADEANYTPTPFSGGSRVIQRGLMAPEKVRNLGWMCYAVGTVLGIGVVLATQVWALLAFGAVGFLVGFLYTAPPLRLAHRGLGELAVAFGFGPLIVVGTWVAFTGSVVVGDWTVPLVGSIPVAFLVAAILYVNQFPDKAGDAAVGKKTLVVRLPDVASIVLFSVLVLGAYAAVAYAVWADLMPLWALLTMLTLPLAVWTLRKVGKDHDHPYKLIPANAATILALHLGTGILLVVGLVIGTLTA